jgi:hypothetical protein
MIQIEQLLPEHDPQEPPPELETADPRLEDAAAAAVRGEYLQAAQVAEGVYAQGCCDARLLGYLLYGAVIERGPAVLSLLLTRLSAALGAGRSAFTPIKRRDTVLDGALFWFLGKLVQQLEHAEQKRDGAWLPWQRAAERGDLASALTAADQLQPALMSLTKRPRSATPLLHLADLLGRLITLTSASESQRSSVPREEEGRFSSASTLQAAPAPSAPEPEGPAGGQGPSAPLREDPAGSETRAAGPEEDAGAEAPAQGPPFQDQEEPPAHAARPIPPPRPLTGADDLRAPAPPRAPLPGFLSPSVVQASARLVQLAEQIELFCGLVRQGQYLHAAVIGAEVQAALDSFDPRAYLPAVLAPYFRSLTAHSHQLAPILAAREHLSFQALSQLYQVDPAGFIAQVRDADADAEDPE